MSTLTAQHRNKLLPDQFALPGKKAYPVENKAHAVDAKARATQQLKAGNLTPGQKAEIDAKADKVLKR